MAKKRMYTKAFKAGIVAEVRDTGESCSKIAKAYNIRPNVVSRWVREANARIATTEVDLEPTSNSLSAPPPNNDRLLSEAAKLREQQDKTLYDLHHTQLSHAWSINDMLRTDNELLERLKRLYEEQNVLLAEVKRLKKRVKKLEKKRLLP